MSDTKTYETVLKALGYDDSESRILSLLLDNRVMAADEIIAESTLSRGKVYQVLKKLERTGKIRGSSDRPANFAPAERFVSEVRESVGKLYETVNTKLAKVRPREDEQVAADVRSVFESLGYNITDVPNVESKGPFLSESFRPEVLFDYVAEDDYRFSISIMDKTKAKLVDTILDFEDIYPFSIAANALDCINYFVFITPNFDGSDRLYNFLKGEFSQLDRTIHYSRPILAEESFVRFVGIEGQTPVVAKTSDNIHDIVVNAVSEDRSRQRLVEEQLNKVHATLNDIETTILDAEVSANHVITRFGRDAFPPLKEYEDVLKLVDQIREPIQSIASREKRNLGLVKQDYMRLSLDINDHASSFSHRAYLPSLETIRKYDEKLSRITQKFRAIGFEMTSLEREVFPRLYTFRPNDRKLSIINPFVFTVPYEPGGPFAIGQNDLRTMFEVLVERVSSGMATQLRFVVGPEGSGKSHSIHNLLTPVLKEKKIAHLVVDCPLKQDIVGSMLDGILNESRVPTELREDVRSMKLQRSFSSLRDFTAVIDQLVASALAHGYQGLVLTIDEFENSLPRTINLQSGVAMEPLPLRQLKEILTIDTPHFGLVIASRSGSFESFKNSLRIQNISEFVLRPEPFQLADVKEVLQHRYSLWNISKPEFSEEALEAVLKKTSGNPRSIVKYLRELYRYAEYKGLIQVSPQMLDSMGPVPLFIE